MPGFDVNDIVATVVVYKAKLSDAVTLNTLNDSAGACNKVLDVIIYDNSPVAQSIPALSHLNCIYHHDVSNPGVSKAYNYAAGVAVQLKKKFLLLLDQDTAFPKDSLVTYVKAINKFPLHNLFCPVLKTSKGIFSPLKYYFRRGMHWNDVTPGVYSLKNKSALNSGMLVELNAYQSVGGFNENIQLYFSDFDFINRFKAKYSEMVVIDLVCRHSLSDIDKVDANSAIKRFKYYVNGSFASILSFKDYIYLFVTVLLRAVKLSWRYKNFVFLSMFLKKYLSEKLS